MNPAKLKDVLYRPQKDQNMKAESAEACSSSNIFAPRNLIPKNLSVRVPCKLSIFEEEPHLREVFLPVGLFRSSAGMLRLLKFSRNYCSMGRPLFLSL